MNNNNNLKRSRFLAMITFFALGNILGAGIYVLLGKVAGEAGYFSPFVGLYRLTQLACYYFSHFDIAMLVIWGAGICVTGCNIYPCRINRFVHYCGVGW